MTKSILLFLCLGLAVLFQGSIARPRRQSFGECQLNRLDALRPDNRVDCEAGRIETWNPNHQQFQCAGVAVSRTVIEPNGLLLPQYSNSPQIIYIVQGRGMTGVLLPGCPETFQESQRGGGRIQDQHQKIRNFRQGDVIALPAGVAHWCFNDGNEPVVAVSLLDTSNTANQLDNTPRSFYLAGNPEDEFEQQQQSLRPGSQQQQPPQRPKPGGRRCNNMYCGLDTRLLSEAFNIDESLARRLQAQNDNRGNIIRVKEGLQQVVRPPMGREQERELERSYNENGVEETICTMRLRENIGDPSRADIFTPEAGRISTVNSHNLPVLRWLQLSAERGVLYNDGLMLPHWNRNAHSVLYAIRGRARIQVVDQNGNLVFDGEVREGQVLTVPQNFAVVKRAGRDRFDWIAFKTNDKAMTTSLAGRTSALRAMPVNVLANAYQISLDDARRIKFNTQETTLTRSRSSQGSSYDA